MRSVEILIFREQQVKWLFNDKEVDGAFEYISPVSIPSCGDDGEHRELPFVNKCVTRNDVHIKGQNGMNTNQKIRHNGPSKTVIEAFWSAVKLD